MTNSVSQGQMAPDFLLPSTRGTPQPLHELRGRIVVLYFYPRDATPGCTLEGQDFARWHAAFDALNAVILGVSRDSLASHTRFRCKENLPFDLLSDPDEQACQHYGVIKTKNLYGKQVQGIERSTFLIDPQGVIRASWRKVKVAGHVEVVLAAVQTLSI